MVLGTGLLVLATPALAHAHEVGLSRGIYTVDGATVDARITFASDELRTLFPELDRNGDGTLAPTELSEGTSALAPLRAGIELTADGKRCPADLGDATLTEGDGAQVRLRYTCPAPPARLDLHLPVLEKLRPGHRHLAQVNDAAGTPLADLVLHARAPTAGLDLGDAVVTPVRPSVGEYFKIGVEHILIGTDHLVFLLGLVVVGGRLRSLIAVVTAFTIGHSLSLALATLGLWAPDPAYVEPAIALSIAYVGLENFLVKDAAGRWRITLPFGFVHGFGFAGVLAEIGVPDGALGLTLLLFNLGVEAGQLLVLALVLPLLALLAKQPAWQRLHGPKIVSAAIVVAGLYWFIDRIT